MAEFPIAAWRSIRKLQSALTRIRRVSEQLGEVQQLLPPAPIPPEYGYCTALEADALVAGTRVRILCGPLRRETGTLACTVGTNGRAVVRLETGEMRHVQALPMLDAAYKDATIVEAVDGREPHELAVGDRVHVRWHRLQSDGIRIGRRGTIVWINDEGGRRTAPSLRVRLAGPKRRIVDARAFPPTIFARDARFAPDAHPLSPLHATAGAHFREALHALATVTLAIESLGPVLTALHASQDPPDPQAP